MSGLFDKGSAGEARLSSASIEDDLDLSGFDIDLLSSLESSFEKNALDLDVFAMGEEDLGPKSPAVGTVSDPLAGPLSGMMADDGSSLLDMEVFTDLSSMLGGVPGGLDDDSQMITLDASVLDEINILVNPLKLEPEIVSETATKSIKRTAEEAFSEQEVSSPTHSNPDHDDYTAKRPRVATADSTVENEEIERPSTSDSPAPSCSGVTPVVKKEAAKYVERRNKNNIASRRSRQTRKQKFQDMEVQAEQLEIANEKLQQQVAELEKLTKVMKDILVQKLARAS